MTGRADGGVQSVQWRFLRMPNRLVNALHTNPDAARWPYIDRLIDLHDAGLIAPEVWRLICRLSSEYETELSAHRERPTS
jgi:hypothetical protein